MNNSGTIETGKVITFYSFKGGVGRSMALVNVATLLSSWGKKVLMVDWDLEAPGLEKFFNGATEGLDTSKQEGLLELLQALQTQETVDWQQYVFSFSTKLSKTPLDLIIAGRNHDQYTEELRNFNVANFYEAQKGAYRLENLRNEWLETYDYVLIDSRTGVTDFGGICTIHMPDILVMLLTPTEQGLRGTLRIAERADKARQSLPFDREKLLVFPLPSRIDGTTEFEKSRQWIKRFAESFEPIFDNWLPADIAPEDFLQRVKIPYIPYFSYGETLPVIEQGMNDPAGLGYAYENIAMLLAQGLDRVDLFWEDRGLMSETLKIGIDNIYSSISEIKNTGAFEMSVSTLPVKMVFLMIKSLMYLLLTPKSKPSIIVKFKDGSTLTLPRTLSDKQIQDRVLNAIKTSEAESVRFES